MAKFDEQGLSETTAGGSLRGAMRLGRSNKAFSKGSPGKLGKQTQLSETLSKLRKKGVAK